MTTRLPALLAAHRLTRADLAAGLALAPSTVTHWLRDGRRPAAATQEQVQGWLTAQGVPEDEAAAWDQAPPPPAPRTGRAEGKAVGVGAATPAGQSTDDTGDPDMLLRRQPIGQATRTHFGLSCDPFSRDLVSHKDVFASPDIHYVRESMWTTARHGGLLAVVGESGSGKTTLLDDIEDRIVRDSAPVVLVRPDVTGMEASDTRGRVLRVAHIQEALIHALTPDAALRQSPEARANQLKAALIAARDADKSVCLAFDEAHAMPIATLKHLKRLLEIKRGFTRLLSIILVGQPELGIRLSERNPEVREVVARCEVVTLDPLDDQLAAYLRWKLQPAGRDLDALIDAAGLDALRAKLGITAARAGGSRAYPLLVGNLFAACLNQAAVAKAPRITAAVVGSI